MKETVRVLLDGDFAGLALEWGQVRPDEDLRDGVLLLRSDSAEYRLFKDLLARSPGVMATEFVEREYSKKELASFDGHILWVNGSFVSDGNSPFVFHAVCAECGFPAGRERVRPLALTAKQAPKKDLAMNAEWELVVSSRVVGAWNEEGLTGASFSPVTVEGQEGNFYIMTFDQALDDRLPHTLRYHGKECATCGRVEKTYPLHHSKEIWVPSTLWADVDAMELNRRWERTFNHRKLISKRAYSLLTRLKATGFWVQPIHTEETTA